MSEKIIDNSVGEANWSQRNNPDDPSTPQNEPYETCNVTAGGTSIGIADWPEEKFNRGFSDRLPMDLLYFMRQNPACLKRYGEIDPKHDAPMNEHMEILAIALDEYLLNPGVKFVSGASRQDIYAHVLAGDGIVIHGDFTFRRADGTSIKGGHYESLVGMKVDDVAGTMAWKIFDPYGDPRTDYLSQLGADIWLTMAQVDAWIKPIGPGGKDAIFIPRYE